MLKRIVVAVIEGGLVGGGVASVLAGLGLVWRDVPIAYGAALVTGIVIGLVAGKPFWAKGAKVETLLKSAVGAFIATGATYGARKWLPDASFGLGSGVGGIGGLPAVVLPVIAIAIALLLEIDDAVGPHATIGPGPQRVATGADRGPADMEGNTDEIESTDATVPDVRRR